MRSLSWWRPRLIPVLVLLGMALFLNDQGSRREPDADLRDLSVVEGTVTAFDSHKEQVRTGNRTSTVSVYTLTLAEYPANVTFRLAYPPPDGVPVGSRVRLEAVRADSALDRAKRFPESRFTIKTEGIAVDGRTIYSAAGEAERAAGAVNGYRIAAAVCFLLGVGWAGVLVMRWRRAGREEGSRAA